MKVYLDNNVVSTIAKNDIPNEMDALMQLLKLRKAGEMEMVTSEVTGTEIGRYKGKYRKNIEAVYLLLNDMPFLEDQKILGFHSQGDHLGGWVSYPRIEDDPISSALRQIGLDQTDAHHLLLAILDECDAFLTCDKKTILRWRNEIERQFPIRLMRPSELVREFTQSI